MHTVRHSVEFGHTAGCVVISVSVLGHALQQQSCSPDHAHALQQLGAMLMCKQAMRYTSKPASKDSPQQAELACLLKHGLQSYGCKTPQVLGLNMHHARSSWHAVAQPDWQFALQPYRSLSEFCKYVF